VLRYSWNQTSDWREHILVNIISLGGPDQSIWLLIMHGDILLGSASQFKPAAEDTAPQSIRRDTADDAHDHVERGSGRRREMDMAAQMPCQPLADLEMLVRRVVITDQMQILVIDVSQSIWPRKSSHSTWR